MDCSLCCESFTEEGPSTPRTLDCGHTFCTRCIQMLNQTAAPRQGPKCPECRASIRSNRRAAANFPKNYKLLELIREKTQPPLKPGADTTQEYRDHRGMDATDPASYAPPSEERGPLGGEPPSLNMDDGDVFIDFGWGGRAGGAPQITRPQDHNPAPVFLEWMTRGWQGRPVQPNANPPSQDLWAYGYDPPTSGTGPAGTGSSSHANRAATNSGSGSNALQQLSMLDRSNPQADIPANAIANGRAVQTSEGFLVCKFFQEGTCRYGPYCWFRHPCINSDKALCKHWQKGQCRMGVGCNFRHGTRVPIRFINRNRNRGRSNRLGNPPSGANDGAPGPSGAPSSSNAVESRGLGSQRVVLVSGNSFSIRQGAEVSGPSPLAGSTSQRPLSESTSPFDSLFMGSEEGWF